MKLWTTKRTEVALLILGVYPAVVGAAPPGLFSETANSAVFFMPNRVTPDPMDLNYPLLCFDVNANGRDEIITGGEIDSVWRVIELDPASRSFSVVAGARLPFPPTEIGGNQGQVRLIDSTRTPGSPKLFVRIVNGSTTTASTGLYDLRTRTLERVTLLGGDPVGIRDLDGDDNAELVTFQGTSSSGVGILAAYDVQMSRQLTSHRIQVGPVQGVALGNLDDDPRWEIATTQGVVYELTIDGIREDGSFAARIDGNPMEYIAVADVDGDGKDEIAAAYGNRIIVIDHDMGKVKWSAVPVANSNAQLQAMRVVDILGNALPEIVIGQVGSGAPGNLILFEGSTGAELRTIQHPDIGVYGLNSCDLDGDKTRELIVGLSRPITGPDRLYVYDPASGLIKWRSENDTGPVRAAVLADLEGDGRNEIMFAPHGVVGVGDLKIYAFDAATLQSRWVTASPLLPELGTGSLNTMAAGDADADGDVDLVIGSSQSGYGRLWAVDARTRTVVRSIRMDAGAEVRSVTFADVNGDRRQEIVAAMSTGRVDVRDVVTTDTLWTASWGATAAREVKAADLDRDGRSDLLVRTAPSIPGQAELFVIDGASRAVRAINAGCLTSIAVLDDSVPGVQIVGGGCDGLLQVIDGLTGGVVQSQRVCSGAIDALVSNKLSTAGPREFLFACKERIGWTSLATAESKMITAVVGDQVGVGNTLFSGGTSAASDHIAVATILGVTLLRPTPSLAPYVVPLNVRTTNIFSVRWGATLNDTVTFGTFDGSAATLEIVEQPAHGSLTLTDARTGQFRYVSRPFGGIDLLLVRARTPEGTSPPTGIPIEVRNTPPQMASAFLSFQATAGSRSSLALGGTDSDGDVVTYDLVQPPTKGTIEFVPGLALYTPANDASGTDEFLVRAFDQVSYSTITRVQVSIQAQTSTPGQPSGTPSGPTATPRPSGGGGGRIDAFILLLMVLATALRIRNPSAQ